MSTGSSPRSCSDADGLSDNDGDQIDNERDADELEGINEQDEQEEIDEEDGEEEGDENYDLIPIDTYSTITAIPPKMSALEDNHMEVSASPAFHVLDEVSILHLQFLLVGM